MHYTARCVNKTTYSNTYTQYTSIMKLLRSHHFTEHVIDKFQHGMGVWDIL